MYHSKETQNPCIVVNTPQTVLASMSHFILFKKDNALNASANGILKMCVTAAFSVEKKQTWKVFLHHKICSGQHWFPLLTSTPAPASVMAQKSNHLMLAGPWLQPSQSELSSPGFAMHVCVYAPVCVWACDRSTGLEPSSTGLVGVQAWEFSPA